MQLELTTTNNKWDNRTTMKVVGYIRVSSEEQVQNFSLSTQEDYIKEEVAKKGYELDRIFREEGKSAKTLQRPALIECLSYCQKNKDKVSALMVYRLDRLSRETSDYLAVRKQLAKYGIELLSATEPIGGTSPTDKFLETILASVATLDNDLRAMKAKDGLKKRFLSGIPHKIPVGYKQIDKEIAPDKKMFNKIKQSWERMATGKYSLSQMAEYMNKLGVRTKHGGITYKITKKSAYRIFSYKFYHGIVESKNHGEIKGGHKKMISEYLYWKVRAVIGGRTQNNNPVRQRFSPEFPLRRLVKCGVCETGFTGSFVTGRNKKYPYYYCPNGCTSSVNRKNMNKKLFELLQSITPTKNTIENFNLLLEKEYTTRLSSLEKQQDSNKKRVKKAKQALKSLIKGHAENKYPEDVFVELKAEYESKIIEKDIVSNESLIDQYTLETVVEFNKVFLSDLTKPYKIGDILQKTVYLGSIFPEGLVWKNNLLEPLKLGTMYAYLQPKSSVWRG